MEIQEIGRDVVKEMVSKKEPVEILVDKLLLLYLVKRSNELGNIGGETKLQKLVYLSERAMLGRKMKGFNFYFHKFDYGPYSPELKDERKQLEESKMLDVSEWELTDYGVDIVDDFKELWTRNQNIVQWIDNIASEFASWSLDDLKKYVYDQPHPFMPGETIESVKMLTPILRRIKPERAEFRMEITDSEIETFDILLDLDTYRDIITPTKKKKGNKSVLYQGV